MEAEQTASRWIISENFSKPEDVPAVLYKLFYLRSSNQVAEVLRKPALSARHRVGFTVTLSRGEGINRSCSEKNTSEILKSCTGNSYVISSQYFIVFYSFSKDAIQN